MSDFNHTNSTKKWYWTDDLARALAAAGHANTSTLTEWMNAPVAIRAAGEALEVAEALLDADEDDPALAA